MKETRKFKIPFLILFDGWTVPSIIKKLQHEDKDSSGRFINVRQRNLAGRNLRTDEALEYFTDIEGGYWRFHHKEGEDTIVCKRVVRK